jgi:hypothetical protein
MTEYTTQDAVKMAMDGDVSGFRSAVSDILMDKIGGAVDAKKISVATSFMSADSEEEIEIQGDTDGDSEI